MAHSTRDARHRAACSGKPQASAGSPASLLGLMFWFIRSTLPGSYMSFKATVEAAGGHVRPLQERPSAGSLAPGRRGWGPYR